MATYTSIDVDDIETCRQPFPFESINSTYTLIARFDICGCAVLTHDKLLLDESNNSRLVLLKDKNHIEEGFEKEIILPSSGPWDVTIIENNIVAVSTDGLMVVNVDTEIIEKTNVIGRCEGLEYFKGSLICGVPKKGVISVDLCSGSTTTVIKDEDYNGPYDLTVHNDKIFLSKATENTNTVSCYTLTGDRIWEFSDTQALKCPRVPVDLLRTIIQMCTWLPMETIGY